TQDHVSSALRIGTLSGSVRTRRRPTLRFGGRCPVAGGGGGAAQPPPQAVPGFRGGALSGRGGLRLRGVPRSAASSDDEHPLAHAELPLRVRRPRSGLRSGVG